LRLNYGRNKPKEVKETSPMEEPKKATRKQKKDLRRFGQCKHQERGKRVRNGEEASKKLDIPEMKYNMQRSMLNLPDTGTIL
jgi:hypothetical protein